MTTNTETSSFEKAYYVNHACQPALQKLHRVIRSYVYFNLIFLAIAAVELALFISFFSFLGQTTILAFNLSVFFLTLFSYLVIRLYFQTKKPEQLSFLCETFVKNCKERMHYREGVPEHHVALANALQKFASELHEKEYTYYAPPPFLQSIAPTLEKFSAFCHWKDLHTMKEFLLHLAIDEHIKVVKCEPVDLQVHAALANAYVMLSSLYADPRKYEGYDEDIWIPPDRQTDEMATKFLHAASRAIEEFKILNDYAPDDPWVHIQLAYSYHDLHMPNEEIKEYEKILALQPEDNETLFKLGMLYFQQGKNANGLRVYEQLKKTNFKKAESLIKFYGAFIPL